MWLAVFSCFLLISGARAQLFDNDFDNPSAVDDWFREQEPAFENESNSDFEDFPDCVYIAPLLPTTLPQFSTEFEFLQRRLKWAELPLDLSTAATRKYYVALMFSTIKKRGVFVYEDDLNHPQARYRSIDIYNASQAFDVDAITGTCSAVDVPKSITCSPYTYYITKEAGYRTDWADDACHYKSTPLVSVSTDNLDPFAPPADKFNSPYDVALKQCVRVQHGSSSKPSFWLNQYYYSNDPSGVASPVKVVITNLDPENHVTDRNSMPMAKQSYDFLAYRPYIKRYEDFEPPKGVCCVGPNTTLCNHAVSSEQAGWADAGITRNISTVAAVIETSDDEYYFVQEYPIVTMLVAVLALPLLVLLFGLIVIAYRKRRLQQLRQRQRVWMVANVLGNENKL